MDNEDETSESFLDALLSMEMRNKSKKTKAPISKEEEAAVHFMDLLAKAKNFAAIKTAVVHPTDKESLEGPIKSAQLGLIEPILIGPEYKIAAIAKQYDFDLKNYKIIDVEHSHKAAEKGVELARVGEVAAVMKGSLHQGNCMKNLFDNTTII